MNGSGKVILITLLPPEGVPIADLCGRPVLSENCNREIAACKEELPARFAGWKKSLCFSIENCYKVRTQAVHALAGSKLFPFPGASIPAPLSFFQLVRLSRSASISAINLLF
ncbi:hypothetical protein [Geotalea uraniireducens]|uniref:hypothetical protein n=1 Tax=Geotalea uraniireducens TaxID=351604 RepID=UPI0024931DFD|nr:hypothetical protein [Geotalea uraniireducens]